MLRESKTGKSAVSELKDAKWNSLETGTSRPKSAL